MLNVHDQILLFSKTHEKIVFFRIYCKLIINTFAAQHCTTYSERIAKIGQSRYVWAIRFILLHRFHAVYIYRPPTRRRWLKALIAPLQYPSKYLRQLLFPNCIIVHCKLISAESNICTISIPQPRRRFRKCKNGRPHFMAKYERDHYDDNNIESPSAACSQIKSDIQ